MEYPQNKKKHYKRLMASLHQFTYRSSGLEQDGSRLSINDMPLKTKRKLSKNNF